MAARPDCPAVPMVDLSTPQTVPGISAETESALAEGMTHGDVQAVKIHLTHHLPKVASMIGLTLAKLVLPLMDHFMGQRAVYLCQRLIGKQGSREPDESMLET